MAYFVRVATGGNAAVELNFLVEVDILVWPLFGWLRKHSRRNKTVCLQDFVDVIKNKKKLNDVFDPKIWVLYRDHLNNINQYCEMSTCYW